MISISAYAHDDGTVHRLHCKDTTMPWRKVTYGDLRWLIVTYGELSVVKWSKNHYMGCASAGGWKFVVSSVLGRWEENHWWTYWEGEDTMAGQPRTHGRAGKTLFVHVFVARRCVHIIDYQWYEGRLNIACYKCWNQWASYLTDCKTRFEDWNIITHPVPAVVSGQWSVSFYANTPSRAGWY